MSATETHSDGDGIECPHCGKVLRDLWDYGWGNSDELDIESECGWCEEPIVLTRIITVDYRCKAVSP